MRLLLRRTDPIQCAVLLLSLLVLLKDQQAAGAAVRDDALNKSLEACLASPAASQKDDEGSKPFKLSVACPQLSALLAETPAARLFDKPLVDETTFDQLLDIRTLLASSRTSAQVPSKLDHAGLKALLADTLIETPSRPLGLWDRFLLWLRQRLAGGEDSEFSWFVELLRRVMPSEEMMRLFVKGTILLTIALALYLVANELRMAGVFWWRSGRPTLGAIHESSWPSGFQPLSWHEIAGLALVRQPPALLRFVIAELMRRELLPNNYSLTDHEFLTHLSRNYPGMADDFRSLVVSSESVLYADTPVDEMTVQGLFLAAGRLVQSQVPV